jgi:hypothetical protein
LKIVGQKFGYLPMKIYGCGYYWFWKVIANLSMEGSDVVSLLTVGRYNG